MGRIRVLDDHLANQIAAGEVVERPASIVKELVENAIDAEATRIQIEIEEGGISLVRVSDNGIGMDREDAKLAFSRHATSKIRRERDLFNIRTLGFRGEALPSIASVARVELTTSCDASQPAVTVRIEGGELLGVEETTRARGTDVTVRDLFYNTPARLKHLKTVNTEVSHVADVVGRLALAHPGIAFSLAHNGRELFRTSGDGKLLHVLYSLYGKQVASHLVSFAAEDLDFSVSGFVSKPEVTRSSRSYFTIILNGRFVRSIPITQAVLKAFGTLLPNGRYPVGVLHIRVDPKLVDVNVHPSKLEVRLSKEAECCRLVEQAVAEAFRKQFLVPAAGKPGGRKAEAEERFVQGRLSWDVPAGKVVREPAASFTGEAVRENLLSRSEAEKAGEPTAMRENELNELNPAVSARGEKISSSVLRSPPPGSRKADLEEPFFRPSIEPGSSHLRNTAKHSRSVDSSDVCTPSDAQTKPLEEKGFPIPSGGEQASPDVSLRRIPEMMPLAQIHGTYIVAQAEDGFYLLDQHAAHERIYYEKFYRELGNPEPKRQQLLLPLTVECSPAEAETVTSQLSRLREWGLEIEPFGGTTFVVRAVPHWFPAGEEESLIRDVIDFLMQHGKVETAKLRDAGAKMMACKAAIKANRHLRRDEMEKLLEQLNLCDNPFTCPHGRPIFVHFSTHELEKMFKRVM